MEHAPSNRNESDKRHGAQDTVVRSNLRAYFEGDGDVASCDTLLRVAEKAMLCRPWRDKKVDAIVSALWVKVLDTCYPQEMGSVGMSVAALCDCHVRRVLGEMTRASTWRRV